MSTSHESLSFWDRHEYKLYQYGHIYAFICGQVVIDYVPQEPLRRPLKALLTVYSHTLSLLLIVVLPGYFGYNYRALVETHDRRMELLIYVYFANTAIKYVTVIVTYVATMVHFEANHQRCTLQRQSLERAFKEGYRGSRRPKRRFEFFMYLKFCLINLMIMVQVCGIFAAYGLESGHLHMHFAIYGFVLWNYTEHMADYFYFISGSVLKYMRQLHVQLKQFHHGRGQWRALYYGEMCDRLEALRLRFSQIHALHVESFGMQQLQLMGLMLSTLINNLTNLFTIFNMLAKQSLEEISYPIVISSLYALCFYLDTYIITLLNEHIKLELEGLALTLRRFSEWRTLDVRLDQEVEHFALQLQRSRPPMLCGMLHLDKRLVYLIAVTAFAYFITLVQFDLYLRKRSH